MVDVRCSNRNRKRTLQNPNAYEQYPSSSVDSGQNEGAVAHLPSTIHYPLTFTTTMVTSSIWGREARKSTKAWWRDSTMARAGL